MHIQSLIVIIVHACLAHFTFPACPFFSRSVPLTATYFHRSFRLAVSYYLKFPIIGLALSSFEDPRTSSPTRTSSSFTRTRLSRKRVQLIHVIIHNCSIVRDSGQRRGRRTGNLKISLLEHNDRLIGYLG